MGVGGILQHPVRRSVIWPGIVQPADSSYSGARIAGESSAVDSEMTKSRTVTIYGIKNCDTMKKARAWLDKHGVEYAFHDYKTAGIERERLEQWCKKAGW